MEEIDFEKYGKESRPENTPEFPTEKHYLAWKIARHLGESYHTWLIYVQQTKLWPGQIEAGLESVKNYSYTKKQQARILMAKFFPKK